MDTALPIRDFARRAGVSAHTIRYYERAGIFSSVPRNAGGHRRYGERHLRWLRFLRNLRVAGMPMATIRRYVALLDQGRAGDRRRLELLREHRDRVAEQLEALRGHLGVLDRKLREGCAPGPGIRRPTVRSSSRRQS